MDSPRIDEKSFALSIVDGQRHRAINFVASEHDLHRFGLAIRALGYLQANIINTALDAPFPLSIIPPDEQEACSLLFLSAEYQNPLNDPNFGVSIELATDDDEIDIPF